MSRFDDIFATTRHERRAALIPYITVGDPSLEASFEIALALAEAGADVIELGVPFSDPVADGLVIQAAGQRALARGTKLADVLELARRVRAQSRIGLLLFSYYNPILSYGLERLARDAVAAGCDGVLATDLIPEEAADYRAAAAAAGLDTVFLAAPTSPDDRLRAIAAASRGFIYAVSRLGVTGARTDVAAGARAMVERLRTHTKLPIALGFGISRPEQARAVAGFADGVVVGTALVDVIARAPAGAAPAEAAEFLRGLRGAGDLG